MDIFRLITKVISADKGCNFQNVTSLVTGFVTTYNLLITKVISAMKVVTFKMRSEY